MQIQPCSFDGWQQVDAPRVRLVAGLDDSDRECARLQARAALRACLAIELGCEPDDLEISNLRNQAPRVLRDGQRLAAPHCSISHAPGLALLAWHGPGPVGIDIQAVEAAVDRHELTEVAQLYLGRNRAQSLMNKAQDALFFDAFASAWVQHEAVLKCAALGLQEWSEVLETQLSAIRRVEVSLVGLEGLAGRFKGAVAWRAG